jgi:C1A family cysteine protease
MPSGRLLGGHAICLTGFIQNVNPTLSTFTFCNSWGTYSGNLGMFTIPYAYIGNSSLSSEWYSF